MTAHMKPVRPRATVPEELILPDFKPTDSMGQRIVKTIKLHQQVEGVVMAHALGLNPSKLTHEIKELAKQGIHATKETIFSHVWYSAPASWYDYHEVQGE